MTRKRIGISNRMDELERVVAGVEAFGKENGLPRALVNDLNVALDELLNNIISYGFSDTAEHAIEVDLSFDGSDVTAVVTDDGRPFDPLQASPPKFGAPLAKRRVGGLGIHFVRNLMDECSYSRQNGRNCLTLRRRV